MRFSRRDFLKVSGLTLSAVAADLGLDLGRARRARAASPRMKTVGATEHRGVCHFCAVGCGLVLFVKNGKLVDLEGDYDAPMNQGGLCPKGQALLEVHENPVRVTKPLYRAPGADHWTEISWDEALDRIARKIKEVRDADWVATETVVNPVKKTAQAVPVNRVDSIGWVGSAEVDNEESYLFTKFVHLIGSNFIEHQARL